jgi:hypothetical protein
MSAPAAKKARFQLQVENAEEQELRGRRLDSYASTLDLNCTQKDALWHLIEQASFVSWSNPSPNPTTDSSGKISSQYL